MPCSMHLNNWMDSIKSTKQGRGCRFVGAGHFSVILAFCSLLAVPLLYAQVMGDEAELARLRAKAEDAMANDDPDSAAMNTGRAALMAAQVAKKQEGFKRELYTATESLLRSQEHTYRAMALFRRAGNLLPASSGVCGSLALAQNSLAHAGTFIAELPAPAPSQQLADEAKQLKEATDNWQTMIESIIVDYQCR